MRVPTYLTETSYFLKLDSSTYFTHTQVELFSRASQVVLISGRTGITWNMSKYGFKVNPAPRNCEKSSNMEVKIWQKLMKSLVQLAFKPFLNGTLGTQIPGFNYPKSIQ